MHALRTGITGRHGLNGNGSYMGIEFTHTIGNWYIGTSIIGVLLLSLLTE